MKNLLLVSFLIFLSVISCTKIPDEVLKYTLVRDVDGNEYHSVVLGDQEWMVENLATTHFNNGSDITIISDSSEWTQTTIPGYCWYNNDPATYKDSCKYGALYNFYAVNTSKLCPSGWHVPSDEEWKTMEKYIGMPENEADQQYWRGEGVATLLKAKEEWYNIDDVLDRYGFKARPAGFRDGYDGGFGGSEYYASWWTSTKYDDALAWTRELCDGETRVGRFYGPDDIGLSIRCIKNSK